MSNVTVFRRRPFRVRPHAGRDLVLDADHAPCWLVGPSHAVGSLQAEIRLQQGVSGHGSARRSWAAALCLPRSGSWTFLLGKPQHPDPQARFQMVPCPLWWTHVRGAARQADVSGPRGCPAVSARSDWIFRLRGCTAGQGVSA